MASGQLTINRPLAVNSPISAFFRFGPSVASPQYKRGSYRLSGTEVGGNLFLSPTKWIIHPTGYQQVAFMIPLNGQQAGSIHGEVVGCSAFRFERMKR
jgi:hypothetical protein